MNASAEVIEGGVFPLNLSVMYKFSWPTMQRAMRYFFGEESVVLTREEAPGTPLVIRKDLDLDSEEGFAELRVLSTFLHEQFHLRHLTGSPYGFLLYMLGARQYAFGRAYLQAWGERLAKDGREPRIPVTEHHSEDDEISACIDRWYVFQEFANLFQGDEPDLNVLEATSQLLLPVAEVIQELCQQALGRDDGFPDFDVGELSDEPIAIGDLTGRAVVEGLARANEYLNAVQLGLPMRQLNRYLLLKQHGEYAITATTVQRVLELEPPDSWIVVARLSDWALQAPVLPFLLQGRSSVEVIELLPSWRFGLLLAQFKDTSFTPDDLWKDQRAVAEELFGTMGWESPWSIADRIRAAGLPRATGSLTRHYVENLQLAAELRHSDPDVFSLPGMGDRGHRLGAVYNGFRDSFQMGATGKFGSDPDTWAIPGSLLSDSVLDAVLTREDLSIPWWVAERLSEFLTHGRVTPGTLLVKEVHSLLGEATGRRLLNQLY